MADVLELLGAALCGPDRCPPEVRETHTAWVLLTADRAYKLKKPVRFDFVDLSTAERRRRACEEEVRVNRVLAPDVVLGVRAVVADGAGGVMLAQPGDPAAAHALDWVVAMRRFDEARTMAAHLARGALTCGQLDAVAATIQRFHAATPIVAPTPGEAGRPSARLLQAFQRNLGELDQVAPGGLRPSGAAARAASDALVARHAPTLDARGAAGRIRDGHGDLRAEHVLLESDGRVTIFDRLEFDPGLRAVDVADDLAFLVMDLESLGARWAADRLVRAYRDAGGDPGPEELLALFAVYRAQVRAKVALLRAHQLADRGRAERHGGELWALAERFAWRARGPLILLVVGPPASGKSWLASALADRSGLPVLSSDLVRKEGLGLDPTARAPDAAYDAAGRAAIYGELADRAGASGSAIVDATFGDPEARGTFFARLDPAVREALRVVECHAPPEVLAARVRARTPGSARGSDAGPEVAGRLLASYVPPDDLVPSARRLPVDTTTPPGAIIDAIAAWVDGDHGRAGQH